MEKNESKGKQVKAKELQSSLSVKMLNIVTQFDMAYGKLRTLRGELGGISEKGALVLVENAQKAVQDFSSFTSQFCAKVRVAYYPPKGMANKLPEEIMIKEKAESEPTRQE